MVFEVLISLEYLASGSYLDVVRTVFDSSRPKNVVGGYLNLSCMWVLTFFFIEQ